MRALSFNIYNLLIYIIIFISETRQIAESISKNDFQKILSYLKSVIKIDNVFGDEYVEENVDQIVYFLNDRNCRLLTIFNRKSRNFLRFS